MSRGRRANRPRPSQCIEIQRVSLAMIGAICSGQEPELLRRRERYGRVIQPKRPGNFFFEQGRVGDPGAIRQRLPKQSETEVAISQSARRC